MAWSSEQRREWRAANREAYNARTREIARARYANDAEYRERVLAKSRARYAANEAYHKAYDRARASDPTRRMLARDRQLQKNYGITAQQWDAIFETQGRVCAICAATESGWHKGWHTDHCHTSGKVRGILCANCNHGIGKFKDDPEALIRAAAYLKSYEGNPKW